MPFWAPLISLVVVVALMIVHAVSTSARAWVWKVLAALGSVMVVVVFYFGLVFAPPEAYMSDVGRIIYVHIPFVWMCMLGFTVNVVCAVGYLFKANWKLDALAEASVGQQALDAALAQRGHRDARLERPDADDHHQVLGRVHAQPGGVHLAHAFHRHPHREPLR